MPSPYKLWASVLALSAGAAAFHSNREADVFFHLELGRAVLEHGARTVPEPYAMPGFEPTCTVPAWLWDVIAYGLHAVGGFTALSLFTIVSAVVCALGIAAAVHASQPSPRFLPWALVSAAALTVAAMRFAMRPQTLALAVVAGFVALALRHVAMQGRARVKTGVALVALALIWAQLHGSFVLAPAVFLIVAIGERLATPQPDANRTDLLVLAGTIAALGSSASGLDVVAYVGSHGYGDAVRFIHEMRPPAWVELVALTGASGKALVLLWMLSLFGLTREGKWQWTAIALALVGHAVLSRGVRFVAEDAILSAPLALAGAENLADWAKRVVTPRVLPALAVGPIVLGFALLVDAATDTRGGYGARFGLGLDETAFPRSAARYLARLPAGTPVLSAFGAGPPLGFWSQRRLRTYVDGRTPMYFDDADYALEREIFTNEEALERGLVRYGFRAAVVERAHGVCDLLRKRWTPVVVEALHTTFVPAGTDAPLGGIDPCGPVYVHPPRTAADAQALDHTIARLGRLGGGPFLAYLRAERALLEQPPNGARAQQELDRSAAPAYARSHRAARVSALLANQRLDGAYELIHEGLAAGDVSLLQFVVRPEMGNLDTARARVLLELAVSALGEAASPPVRSLLAAICVQQGDAECARFHALRAAARAAPNVEPTLLWLSEHAGTERKRADARAWLDVLREERRAASAESATAE